MRLRNWLSDVLQVKAEGAGEGSSGGERDLSAFQAIIDRGAEAGTEKAPETEDGDDSPAEDEPAEESTETDTTGDELSAGSSSKPKGDADEGRDDILSLAKSYGLGEEEAEGFTSREELEKALALLDRQLLRVGGDVMDQENRRRQMLSQPVEKPVERVPEPQQRIDPGQVPKDGSADDISAYVAKLEELGYDKEVVNPIKALAARVQAMEAERAHVFREQEVARQQAYENYVAQSRMSFLRGIDAIGDESLFGSSKSATPEQQQNVAKLAEAVQVLQAGLQATGRDPSLTEELVARAFRTSFGKQVEHRGKVERSKGIIAQSNQRMGTGRASQPPKKTAYVEGEGLHPNIAKWWSENVTNQSAS